MKTRNYSDLQQLRRRLSQAVVALHQVITEAEMEYVVIHGNKSGTDEVVDAKRSLAETDACTTALIEKVRISRAYLESTKPADARSTARLRELAEAAT